jgi:hypothetical protein
MQLRHAIIGRADHTPVHFVDVDACGANVACNARHNALIADIDDGRFNVVAEPVSHALKPCACFSCSILQHQEENFGRPNDLNFAKFANQFAHPSTSPHRRFKPIAVLVHRTNIASQPVPPYCAVSSVSFPTTQKPLNLGIATVPSQCCCRDAVEYGMRSRSRLTGLKASISSARVIATYINPRSRRSCSALSTFASGKMASRRSASRAQQLQGSTEGRACA